MSSKIINVFKPVGWTPLQALEKTREIEGFDDIKMSYAGKLDPMADGVLIILSGDKTLEQERYQKLNKEYIAEIVLGFSTDSFDSLGLIKDIDENYEIDKAIIDDTLSRLKGRLKIGVPPFSSFEVEGKPLFWWARENKLNEIEIPKKEMRIFDNSLLEFNSISKEDLIKNIKEKISKVEGDFRQKEIIKSWDDHLSQVELNEFPLIRVKFKCSSGTYIRSLVDEISNIIKVPSFLYGLTRTKVGLEGFDKELFWAGDSINFDNYRE